MPPRISKQFIYLDNFNIILERIVIIARCVINIIIFSAAKNTFTDWIDECINYTMLHVFLCIYSYAFCSKTNASIFNFENGFWQQI